MKLRQNYKKATRQQLTSSFYGTLHDEWDDVEAFRMPAISLTVFDELLEDEDRLYEESENED